MNAFEDIIKLYLEENGYWVRQSVKVNITIEEKRELRNPTMPRPEIDLVALKVKDNELLLVEVKSFLDSQGVYFGHNDIGDFPPDKEATKRYRLLADNNFQKIVTKRLKDQFLKDGLINNKTKIKYALAVGKFYPNSELDTKAHFSKKGWILFTPQQIKETIRALSKKGWEDNLVVMTAKLTKGE